MNELVPVFKDTLFTPTYEIAAEFAEVGIDFLMESDELKGISVVGALSAICKMGDSIYERNLIKQTSDFIVGFTERTISQKI